MVVFWCQAKWKNTCDSIEQKNSIWFARYEWEKKYFFYICFAQILLVEQSAIMKAIKCCLRIALVLLRQINAV